MEKQHGHLSITRQTKNGIHVYMAMIAMGVLLIQEKTKIIRLTGAISTYQSHQKETAMFNKFIAIMMIILLILNVLHAVLNELSVGYYVSEKLLPTVVFLVYIDYIAKFWNK